MTIHLSPIEIVSLLIFAACFFVTVLHTDLLEEFIKGALATLLCGIIAAIPAAIAYAIIILFT